MLPKHLIVGKIMEKGLVAVVRAESAEQAGLIAEACIAGGVAAIEITFTVPGAIDVIKTLTGRYRNGEIIIGAGTVLDPETARIAILAGAQYIVSPALDLPTVKLCHRYQIPVMPGAMTMREIIAALESGADVVKVFPGDTLGPGYVKAIKGPLPQAPIMPTGGVNLDNVGEWIKAGCIAVGVGGNLIAGAKTGDYQSITELSRQFIARIRQARGL